jgi:hypothetical protein
MVMAVKNNKKWVSIGVCKLSIGKICISVVTLCSEIIGYVCTIFLPPKEGKLNNVNKFLF